MLYDPKWEKKIEAHSDPLSLSSLINWLEHQPANARYCYSSNGHCLLAQFAKAQGFVVNGVAGSTWRIHPTDILHRTDFPPHFEDIAAHDPHTFGGALERARAAVG